MKSAVYISFSLTFFFSFLIKLLNCNAEEAHLKRNRDTINFFLSKFQTTSIENRILRYPNYSLLFNKFNFYPTITTNMKIEPRTALKNHFNVNSYIITFYCDLFIHLSYTTKILEETDFIVEITVTDSIFVAGDTLYKPMKFLSLHSFLTSYSENRNFLNSRRFLPEFEQKKTKEQFNQMISEILWEQSDLLDSYNYPQVDLLAITLELITIKKTIELLVEPDLIIKDYHYYSYAIPDSKVIHRRLDASYYNITLGYRLINNGVIEPKDNNLQIVLPMFMFSYDQYNFNLPKYLEDNKNLKVNNALFNEFKTDFRAKAKEYYDRFEDKNDME